MCLWGATASVRIAYLTGRKQAVTINNTSSSECELIRVVHQGSVLGPILFTCYIKPLGDIARKRGVGLRMYADHTRCTFLSNLWVVVS